MSPASPPIDISILPTLAPSVTILTPTFGTRVLSGSTITLYVRRPRHSDALPSESPSHVVQSPIGTGIDFLRRFLIAALLKTMWVSPSTPGIYNFSATATQTTLDCRHPVHLQVINVDHPPVVSTASPQSNTIVANGLVAVPMTFIASGPNPGALVAEVDLYVDNVYVDSGTLVGTSSYTYTWTKPVLRAHIN